MILAILRRLGIVRKFCAEGHFMEPSWRLCPVCIAPVRGWLVGKNGTYKNKVSTLHEGKVKIGTAIDCEVKILHESVSRHHAMITNKEKSYTIIDLNSAVGTFVNNIQVSHKDIIDGDILKFGEMEFVFKCL